MGNKPKILYFYVFGCKAYIFLSIEVCANKLTLHSELMIFIGYEDDGYYFICHIQRNTIFCSIHAISDKGLFPKCTNSHTNKCKLYDELLDKTSSEIESLTPNSSGKDGPASVPILHISVPSIHNNPPTCFPLSSLSYKSISLPPTSEPKKPTVEIKETSNVDSDIEMQPLSPQQPLQPGLQTLQEGPKLRRSKH